MLCLCSLGVPYKRRAHWFVVVSGGVASALGASQLSDKFFFTVKYDLCLP